ncbi:homocysteine S-methyltransferase family protein [Mycobacterium sp. KBS0706]|uniref:homocysteine S-methyltransferase family protein n=1 Tax=Mycobacterium sp. KBS0706 TaxID=2578109 RepID=UPI00110F88B7|nr:homocysteine S-methyltransferase family protein [Mycobacterium sp. KBS0706]TSD85833.1 homocysteine S-methyltransferase family protein [Mycobacterium sp. KBS0706]
MSGPGVTLLDGGMGRQLARMGAPFRQPEWSALALIEAPETVQAAHAAFIAAGAEVITTNSYAVVPFHIGEDRFAAQGLELADLSGRLARQAAASAAAPVRVAGSLPPLFGSYRPDLFEPERAPEIANILVEGLAPYVDFWLAETQSSIREAAAAAAAVAGHGKTLWISYTIEDERPEPGAPLLRSGEPVSEAVRTALGLGAEAVLFNCSQPEAMGDAVAAAARVIGAARSPARIGVYANAFPPQPEDAAANDGLSELRADLDPDSYLGWIRRWVGLGASLVGGCCGIGPEHIARIRKALPELTA